MKKKPSKKTESALQRVSLKYFFPHASTLYLAGSFNEWNEARTSFEPVGDGYWAIELELAPGPHEFRLIVDGAWIDVPDAVEQVENPFGSRNAVLLVAPVS